MSEPLAAPLQLNPGLKLSDLAERFAIAGRFQIADFLTPAAAARLASDVSHRVDWHFVIQSGKRVWDIERSAYDALPADQRRAIEDAIAAEAHGGFRFRFDSIRIPDHGAGVDDSLGAFARLMNEPGTIEILQDVTRCGSITFADAQATRFRPSDFLGAHDDDVSGKHRRFAYVYTSSRDWHEDYGGLLQFLADNGSVTESFTPRYNSLALFSVPQRHHVSAVTSLATNPRLSITGWLREKGG